MERKEAHQLVSSWKKQNTIYGLSIRGTREFIDYLYSKGFRIINLNRDSKEIIKTRRKEQ